jgi:hypothetical protein
VTAIDELRALRDFIRKSLEKIEQHENDTVPPSITVEASSAASCSNR